MSSPTISTDPGPPATNAVSITSRALRRPRVRALKVGLALLAGVVSVFVVSISTGELGVPMQEIVPAILGDADTGVVFIVQTIRLPRALTALLVGVGFGIAGAVFQSLLRNPLASPDVLGVNAGASLLAVFFLISSSIRTSPGLTASSNAMLVPTAALVGAFATATLMYLLAYRRGVSPYRLILIGIGVGAVARAATEVLLANALVENVAGAFAWLAGSLNTRQWIHVVPLAIGLAAVVPLALVLNRKLKIMQLGDETAIGLGMPVERTRLGLLAVAVAAAGLSVAAAGPIAFVALMAAPVARWLSKSPGPSLILASLVGALLVSASDLIAQNLFSSTQIPVGIVTGAIGAPYMLWLLSRANRVGKAG